MLHVGRELVPVFVFVDGRKSVSVVVLVRVSIQGLENVKDALTIVMVKWSAASAGTLVLLAGQGVVLENASKDGRKSAFAAAVTRLPTGQENVYLFENNVRDRLMTPISCIGKAVKTSML